MKLTRQRGASLIIVLVMLTVLLAGTLSLVRMTETSGLLSGNVSYKSASLQASEVGLSEAFAQMKALADPNTSQGNWYFACTATSSATPPISGECPSPSSLDAAGIPVAADWSRKVVVGQYEAAYVIERLCEVTPVTDQDSQCFVKRLATTTSAKAGAEALEAPTAVQYRLTVSVLGPKRTRSFVQVLAAN